MTESQPKGLEERAAVEALGNHVMDNSAGHTGTITKEGEEMSRKRKPEEGKAKHLKKKKAGGTAQDCSNQETTTLAADDSETGTASSTAETSERRQLRKEQRQTLEELRNSWLSTTKKGLDKDALQAERQKHNELFRRVRHAREFKLDAEILSARASNIQELVTAAQQTHRFDPVMFVCKLKERVNTVDEKSKKTSFDWSRFGREASVVFKCVPSRVTFLVGPLSSVAPGKKLRRAYNRGSNEEDQPLVEQVLVASNGKKERDSPAADAAALVKVIKKELRKQCAQARSNEIDMIPFLVNPHSFTQTVENFLNFSHLVKKGEASVRKASDGMIYCTSRSIIKKDPSEGNTKDDSADDCYYPARQIIMPLSVKEWKALVEAYSLNDGGLPDRGYHSKDNSLGETDLLVATTSVGLDDSEAVDDEEDQE